MQGQTVGPPSTVALDLKNMTPDSSALAYVLLSRAKELKQIAIVNNFKEESIHCNADARTELRRLERVSINANPSPYFKRDMLSIKIATLNCRGLLAHIKDITTDHFLAEATVINLLGTSLDQEQESLPALLPNYTPYFYSIGSGKGIATFVKTERKDITPHGQSLQSTCQIVRLSALELDIISVYKSSSHNRRQLMRDLENLVDPQKPTFIAGDFNIDNSKTNSLAPDFQNLGFKSAMNEATHIHGSHLDHAYFRDPSGLWVITLERYSSYYSDHDLITAVLTRKMC